MEEKQYDLYLDESGNFEDTNLKKGWTPSFAGGILCPSRAMTRETIDRLISGSIHATENYDEHKEQYFGIIESLKKLGGRIVLFENNEKVHICDGDTTYLNIVTGGLTKLLRDLHCQEPQTGIKIHTVIATRQNSEEREKGNIVRIMEKEYLRRFEEKMYVSLGRNRIEHVDFSIEFANAQRDKRLMFADIICNTWLTRNGKQKFSEEDRARIRVLYEDSIRYEVYEDPDAEYLRRLISEHRIGEAVAQLCTRIKRNRNLLDVRDILLERISQEYPEEREIYFSYISLRIGQFTKRRDYRAGIQFAERYKEWILLPLAETEEVRDSAAYWLFDTDFYLLTMYDHIGDADRCAEYASLCKRNAGAVSHSWEHMDYYFRYRIRELNRMIGCFDFEGVLRESAPLIDALLSTKELFSMISPDPESPEAQRSELLGKVYGVRLEAYTNLLREHPEYASQALEVSDLAIAEFTKPYDISRQHQYRCLLFVTIGEAEKALGSLLKAYNLDGSDGAYARFVDKALPDGAKPDVFALYHYTNVMLLLKQKEDQRAGQMRRTLAAHPRFLSEIKTPNEDDDYPWNLILWNLGRYSRLTGGEKKAANDYFERALALTTRHKAEKTMYSFAVCMAADRLAWATEHESPEISSLKKNFERIYGHFTGMTLPDTMAEWFGVSAGGPSAEDLRRLVRRVLK